MTKIINKVQLVYTQPKGVTQGGMFIPRPMNQIALSLIDLIRL